MIQEDFQFHNNLGQPLSGRIYKKSPASDAGIIFSHGLFSSKDGYKITRLAHNIVKCGITLMTFDFSFSGESAGNISDISILQEVEDLRHAVSFFTGYGIKKIHLMGSSMGASVTILYASEWGANIQSIILIAAPLNLEKLILDNTDIASIDSLPPDGMTAIDGIPIRNSFFREVKSIDICAAVKKINKPVMAIHGGRDSVVSISNLDLLEKNLSSPLKKIVIDDGDHNLTRDIDLDIMRQHLAAWINALSLR